MRKLGLIGGMSWLSTRTYYEHINRRVQAKVGAPASAPLLIESLDFAPLVRLSSAADWARAAGVLSESAKRLEAAGATALLICANSMHKIADRVTAEVSIPILHIAEIVAEKMAADGVKKAGILGTRNVMVEDWYREKLIDRDIALLPPEAPFVEALDKIIYGELLLGKATRQAERDLKTIITNFEQDGADAVVLAATELEMVVDVDANVLPIYDGTRLHAEAGADWILGS